MAISAGGVGSGLDVTSLVSQLMTLERQPLAALEKKEAGYQAQISALGSVRGVLSAFQGAARALAATDSFQRVKAVSADPTVFAATASTAAVPGAYAIEVKQLAQAHKLASQAFANTTDALGGGTLYFQVGADPVQSVAIGSSVSLAGVRDAINTAAIGVSASILNDGTGYRLVITSKRSGADYGVQITLDGLPQLATWTETAAKRNAILKVDGIDNINKPSNSVSDVIEGVTLNLAKTSAAGVATALTVSRDSAAGKAALEQFVQGYNTLQGKLKDLTAYDPATKTRGLLQGDAATLGLLDDLRSTLNTPLAGRYRGFAQVGIALQLNGTLKIDGATLQSALDAGVDDVAALAGGYGAQLDTLVGRFLSATGPLASRTDGLNRSIGDIDERRAALNSRLAKVEERYRAQFNALDGLISRLRGTSDFLTNQLGLLPGANASKG